jgi:hypothetical protein
MTKRTIYIVVLIALLMGLVVLAQGATLRLTGNDQGYEPPQPVAYSHRLHAGELEIACQYCHYGAERSRHAGIPPTSVCMNCHRFVTAPQDQVKAEQARAQREGREPVQVTSAEIQKIYDSLGLDANGQRDPQKKQKAIRWRQIHHVPDFVYFDHRRHVAANVTCQTCHGEVQTMERVGQFADLSMGWCLTCHRDNNTKASQQGSAPRSSIDCVACHY